MIPEGIEIRAARPEEEDAALSLVHTPPGPEAAGIAGREEWAIALGDAVQALGGERELVRLSLTTRASNPARRLYARQGYRVTAESRVPGYFEFTGATGRVRMEKTLGETEGSTLANSSGR